MTALTEHTYTDNAGITRVVLLPEGEADVTRGIPVSLDVSELFDHAPPGFSTTLQRKLADRGLLRPQDYLKPGAGTLIQAALLATIKQDAMAIIAYAREQVTNG